MKTAALIACAAEATQQALETEEPFADLTAFRAAVGFASVVSEALELTGIDSGEFTVADDGEGAVNVEIIVPGNDEAHCLTSFFEIEGRVYVAHYDEA